MRVKRRKRKLNRDEAGKEPHWAGMSIALLFSLTHYEEFPDIGRRIHEKSMAEKEPVLEHVAEWRECRGWIRARTRGSRREA
jgi:hypothetical protein